MAQAVFENRVLSGMRSTGGLHLGHYHGVLKNWIKLQHEYECFFFAADWHALTTHYESVADIQGHVMNMVVDWLAAGINPGSCTMFIQSWVPEHAELHLLLSMMTPLGWLERVPSFKDQQAKLKDRDLDTYGFLGYPLLQTADILIYKAGCVPVGADQVAHIEITREIARRFNHLFGRTPEFDRLVDIALKKIGKKNAKLYLKLQKRYQEQGELEALDTGRALVEEQKNITIDEMQCLLGHLEGEGKEILPEPKALLTPTAKMPGLDGNKMSKSYDNTITLRDSDDQIQHKIRTMQTDPARVRRTDPGDPLKCPVWQFHEIYSTDEIKSWVQTGCKSAGIGCVECKQPVIEQVQAELRPIRIRCKDYAESPEVVLSLLAEGAEKARDIARETIEEVREAMGLDYR